MRLVVMLAGLAAAVAGASAAHADPSPGGSDASFLAALKQAGITFESPNVAIGVGKRACQLMDQGNPEYDVIKNVSNANPGFTMDGAAQFTMIAASAYCPAHLGQPITPPPPPPPTPLPPSQWPIIDFPIITPGAA
ncbi:MULTISPECIES: DUF732 domain-containing protein [unclassified Mycobacterium]|uniref:DUF732 domain-containing protein n=1 Tax=unclassified Mycobacterium TaxID=2642494 RepID=UPI000A76B898|nr:MULTISPECIES: DUF732 domain-containing protein [unclassified Mycobacterium]